MLNWKRQLLIFGNGLALTLSLQCISFTAWLWIWKQHSLNGLLPSELCYFFSFFFSNSYEWASCWGAGQEELCIDTFVQACVTQLYKVLFFLPISMIIGIHFVRVYWLCTSKKRCGGGMWMRLTLRYTQVLGRGWCTMWECSENIYRKCVLLASLECQDMCGS